MKTYGVNTLVAFRHPDLTEQRGLVVQDRGDSVILKVTVGLVELSKEFLVDESDLTLEEFLKFKLVGKTITDVELEEDGIILEFGNREWLHSSVINVPGTTAKQFDVVYWEPAK